MGNKVHNTVSSLFNDDLFRLPITQPFKIPISYDSSDSLKHLLEILNFTFIEYGKRLRENAFDEILEPNDRGNILKFCNLIQNSIKSFLTGRLAEAVTEFENKSQLLYPITDFLPIKTYPPKSNLYRLRQEKENFTFDKKDLFHIPVQLRSKISTQRFSISGFPCLYLGSSVQVCWEELNRPNFNEIQLARFENIETINVYNLCFSQFNIIDKGISKNNARNLLYSYPLIAACSFQVSKHQRTDPFKIEYVFPQILFQILLKQEGTNAIGIVYSSTRKPKIEEEESPKYSGLYENIVLPTSNESLIKEYCDELKRLFRMTDVIAGWPIELIINADKLSSLTDKEVAISLDGISIKYNQTKFGILEALLDFIEAKPIDF